MYGTAKDPKYLKQSWDKRTKPEESPFLISTYSTKLVIKIVWHWYKSRHVGQVNTLESQELSPRIYSQPISDKGARTPNGEKGTLFKQRWLENWRNMFKTMTLDPYFTPLAKN